MKKDRAAVQKSLVLALRTLFPLELASGDTVQDFLEQEIARELSPAGDVRVRLTLNLDAQAGHLFGVETEQVNRELWNL